MTVHATRNTQHAPRPTSIDVAKAAGVSQSTVSRVFSGGNVSEDAKARVLAAAAALGYQPSAIARSLSTQRTGIVGIVMADITSPFYPYVLEKFTQKLQEIGLRILLFNAPPHRDVDDTLPLVLQYQVDAIIITSATLSSAMADECAGLGIPVLLFNRYVPNTQASAVCCDNVAGGRLVADLLVTSGHQRLAYIAGLENTSTNRDRERGFRERLSEQGVTTWQREQGAYTYDSGYDAAKRLLNGPDRPDALFCGNDIMALGALDAARDLGVTVPDALSVIGFDDIPAAAWSAYGLTTVRQPVNRMVEAVVELLTRQLADPTLGPETRFMPGQLVRRRTVRTVAL
ncbi:MAG: LacI family DNA-binding transcriptional regulator [Caldilinea sp. CFX5]|nr:LacI family DNA-binding transcriptional regulator [Caldilinea sp. CFX5]